jgi:hypothetical protein
MLTAGSYANRWFLVNLTGPAFTAGSRRVVNSRLLSLYCMRVVSLMVAAPTPPCVILMLINCLPRMQIVMHILRPRSPIYFY